MRISILGAAALAVVLAPWAAAAQDSGFYAEVFGGPTYLEDFDIDSSLADELRADTGFNVGGALGASLPLAIADLRVEGQIAYRRNKADEIETGGVDVSADGDVSALSGMGNAYVDLDFGLPFAVWVGAGVGYARLDLDVEALGVDVVDDDDDVFAYQGMAGISYDLSETIGLSLGYTYFRTEEATFTDEVGDDFDTEYESHNVKVGLLLKL